MTDIFTHAVIINNISQYLTNDVKILDIGTGHGYLAFLIDQIIKNKGLSGHSVIGIDINEKSIEFCKEIQRNYFK